MKKLVVSAIAVLFLSVTSLPAYSCGEPQGCGQVSESSRMVSMMDQCGEGDCSKLQSFIEELRRSGKHSDALKADDLQRYLDFATKHKSLEALAAEIRLAAKKMEKLRIK